MSLISAQFYNMTGRYERVCVGWHCAKVKGHAELKIEKSRVKTFIYDFPNYTIPAPTVSVVMSTYANFFKKRLRS